MIEGRPFSPLWGRFPEHRVIFRDDAVVVVDKPAGLATHAPEEGRFDDVLSWLRLDARARGVSDYFGIHQRLDRETSGVLMFAASKAANPSLARQFEGREVDKSYLAVVQGKLSGSSVVLEHYLRPGDGGVMTARPARGPARQGEQLAQAEAHVVRRSQGRTLVRIEPRTGRTHQVRVQLATAGAPIVGDVAYGGPPAERVMLHASRLALHHPTSGARLELEAQTPISLENALAGGSSALPIDERELTVRFREAAERRFGIAARGDTDALRLVNGEGDGAPGITVDLYGEHAVVSFYEELEDAHRSAVLAAVMALGVRGVYAKFRPKNASRVVDTRRTDVAPSAPVVGTPAEPSFVVTELGVPFEVRLGDGLSTGLFLDMREGRRRVRELASGKRVLNLFAYTGGFSVVGSLGGARSTTTVDVSKGALEWAERNLARVAAPPSDHSTVEADVFDFLERAKKRGERWDLVVIDPPSFSTTKRSRFSADGEYEKLAVATFAVCSKGAQVLACTNHKGVSLSKLRRALHGAAREACVTVDKMRDLPPPPDYPPPPGLEPHLKSVLVTIARSDAPAAKSRGRR